MKKFTVKTLNNITLIIPQKESGTGSIYDLASEHFTREIKIPKNIVYAIVCPAYFNIDVKLATRDGTAAYQYYKLQKAGYCPQIFDKFGSYMQVKEYGQQNVALVIDNDKPRFPTKKL